MHPHDSCPTCIDMKHHGMPYGHKAAKSANQRNMYSHAILFRTVVVVLFLFSYLFILLLLGRRALLLQFGAISRYLLSVSLMLPHHPLSKKKPLCILTHPTSLRRVLVAPMLSPSFAANTTPTYLFPNQITPHLRTIPSVRCHFLPRMTSLRSGDFVTYISPPKSYLGTLEKTKKRGFFFCAQAL